METEESAGMVLLSAFADDGEDGHLRRLRIGEGLVGQCAAEKRRMLITDLPENTVPIRSGLFEAVPRNVIVLPVLFEDRVKAVIELASLSAFTASHLAFLEQLTASIGIVLNSIEATMQTEGLLKQSQQLATELQTQQKELQQTNEQLAQKAQQLAEQNVEVERKNQEIEQARRALEEKAKELALTSKYKSEFLANMSHELRTPLNSILVLGQQLSDNPDGNLTPKQVEFARTIHGAGTDLLNLISDILDLSKIESGTVSVEARGSLLRQPARNGGSAVPPRGGEPAGSPSKCRPTRISPAAWSPTRSVCSRCFKNLLSNAFKFTEHGGVAWLSVSVATKGWSEDHPILSGAASVVAFEVTDTGIGIPLRQAAHHLRGLPAGRCRHQPQVRRNRPGTGHQPRTGQPAGRRNSAAQHARQGQHLHALSAADLRRAVRLEADGVGVESSSPTLPLQLSQHRRRRASGRADRGRSRQSAARRRGPADRRRRSALCPRALRSVARQGIQGPGRHARRGGLALAREFHPTAVSLDVFLPDMLGWTVLNHLKQDPATRHIPVQMLTLDEDRHHGLSRGAFAFVTKPTTPEGLESALARIKEYAAPRRKRLLVVEDNPAEQLSIRELLGHDDIDVTVVCHRRRSAWSVVTQETFDCVVLDLRLPDMTGFEVLERLRDTSSSQRSAGRRLHRQRTVAGRRRAPAHAGPQRGGQGRGIAGAAAG